MPELFVHNSTPGHPGLLTAQEIAELADGRPLDADYDPNAGAARYRLGRSTESLGGPERGDAGLLIITLLFVFDKVSGGALERIGEQLTEFVEKKLRRLMARKRKSTEAATGAYPFRSPRWDLKIEASGDDLTGISATISASTPEAMSKAAELLAETLKRDASGLDLNHELYDWDAREVRDRVRVVPRVYKSDGKGGISPAAAGEPSDVPFG